MHRELCCCRVVRRQPGLDGGGWAPVLRLVRVAACVVLRAELERLDIEAFRAATLHVPARVSGSFVVYLGASAYLLKVSFRAKKRPQ